MCVCVCVCVCRECVGKDREMDGEGKLERECVCLEREWGKIEREKRT